MLCWLRRVISTLRHARAADPATEYRTSLTDVYGAYQIDARPARGVQQRLSAVARLTEKAFTGWHTRHKKLIDELDQRFNMMIHAHSKDEKDYARNIGKYEGAILRQREEVKQTLLQQQRADLEAQCKGLPEFLQSADSDLEKEFAEELWRHPSNARSRRNNVLSIEHKLARHQGRLGAPRLQLRVLDRSARTEVARLRARGR